MNTQGRWRHYKGGVYAIIGLAETHEHNGDVDVVYMSCTHCKLVTRPLTRDSRNQDAWEDKVLWPDGIVRGRFVHEDAWGQDFFDRMFAKGGA
jgi:hypothetical protein